jgi:hypothetical protein
MKKILTLTVIVGSSLSLFGQVTVIPKLGVNRSSITFDKNTGFGKSIEPKFGFQLGLGLAINISDKMSVQPELSYIKKGWSINFDLIDGNGERWTLEEDFTLNYIEIPVLLKYFLGTRNFRYFINAGPSIAYGVGGKAKGKYAINNRGISIDEKITFGDQPSTETSILKEYLDNRWDIGIQVGGGVQIANKFMVEIRYGHGISSFSNPDGYIIVGHSKSQNRVIQLTLGIPVSTK